MPDFKENKGLFLRPFSIKGRIGRKEYIISCVITAVIVSIPVLLFPEKPEIIGIFSPFIFWFLFAQSCKRGHDLGWPLILQILVSLFPLMWVSLIIFKGDNSYGNSPRKNE